MKITHLFTLLVKSVYHTLNVLNSPPPVPQNKFVFKILVHHRKQEQKNTNIFILGHMNLQSKLMKYLQSF